jgi:hypothetical protein
MVFVVAVKLQFFLPNWLTGIVTTFAGNVGGSANGIGTSAAFLGGSGLAVDSNGIIFLGDAANQRIRKISTSGNFFLLFLFSFSSELNCLLFFCEAAVTTYAGYTSGFLDGQGTSAMFNNPYSAAVDSIGRVFVADYSNSAVRMISTSGNYVESSFFPI